MQSNAGSGMNEDAPSDADLAAYLDETLDSRRAAVIESMLPDDPTLIDRLQQINLRRSRGIHTVGEIWRRHQIGVPSETEMGSYLLGVLDQEHAAYIDYRINDLACPFTIALRADLLSQNETLSENVKDRRQRFFVRSSSWLPGRETDCE